MPIFFVRDRSQLNALIAFIVIMALLAPVDQIYAFATKERWGGLTSSGTVRLGLGGASVIASGFLAIIIFRNDLRYYLLATFPILSILLTGHRSGFIALGAAMMTFFKLTKKTTKSLLLVYLLSGSLLLVLTGLEIFTGHNFIEDTMKRGKDTFNTEVTTSKGRLEKISNAFDIFKRRPIFGIGYNFERIRDLLPSSGLINTNAAQQTGSGRNPLRHGSTDDPRRAGKIMLDAEYDVLHPHNFLFRLLAHTGLVGTALLIYIIMATLKICRRLVQSDTLHYPYGIYLYCSIVFFLVFALWNTTFVADGWFFWLLCGASVVLVQRAEADRQDLDAI
jgi:O-antigen ligase